MEQILFCNTKSLTLQFCLCQNLSQKSSKSQKERDQKVSKKQEVVKLNLKKRKLSDLRPTRGRQNLKNVALFLVNKKSGQVPLILRQQIVRKKKISPRNRKTHTKKLLNKLVAQQTSPMYSATMLNDYQALRQIFRCNSLILFEIQNISRNFYQVSCFSQMVDVF